MKKEFLYFLFAFNLITGKSSGQAIAFQQIDTIPVVVSGNTLKNPWAGGINFPLVSEIDLNGDGLHDLFVYDRSNNRISTFLNDGTPGANAWVYAPQYVSRFPGINRWVRLYDYNCDGKMDLFMLSTSCYCGVEVWRNDYTPATGLQFTLVTTMLYETYLTQNFNLYADAVSMPTFGDVDGDGDMDILGYNSIPDGRMIYHRNYSVEHGHGCDSLEFNLEDSKWGNFRLATGSTGPLTAYCFGCRSTAGVPLEKNALENYDQSTAAVRDDTVSSVFMIDVDGDNDKDLLFGDSGSSKSLLVVNGGTPASAQMVSQDTFFPVYNLPVNISDFTVHSYIDLDNDSIKDLLAVPTNLENTRGMWFYKNTGRNDSLDLHLQTSTFLVDQMIDVGEGACPVLFDADGDGLKDLVIGNYGIFNNGTGAYKNGLHVFRNTGTMTNPSFQLTNNDYANVGSMGLTGPLFPAFGDLDGDGDEDMILGESYGKLYYFNNTAGAGNPANFQLPFSSYMHIKVGNASTPQLIDLNRDGLLDLVVGEKNGYINYFQNTGTVTVPFFDSIPTDSILGGINVQNINTPDGFAVPFVYDDSGQYKLLVSCGKGIVYLYDQIDGNLTGNFHLVDSLIYREQGTRTGFNLAVSGGDLNHDGLMDMLLGLYSGGVCVFMQYHPSSVSELSPALAPGFTLFPNPSDHLCTVKFFNLDGIKEPRLTILNYLGQKIYSKEIRSNHETVETKDFPSGVYLLHLSTTKNSFTQKLVVKH
ncbi:MAG: T9SS type A sorting domain-containing protein [Bacteroidetes bacterium]|nr:T9SS type A sorting domain-containing protein [Bacteroidota bacterium]